MPIICWSFPLRAFLTLRFWHMISSALSLALISLTAFTSSSFAQSATITFTPEPGSGLSEMEIALPSTPAQRTTPQARRRAASAAQRGFRAPPQSPLAIDGQTTLGLMTGELDGTFAQIGSDIATVVDTSTLRVVPLLGRGSLQNLGDLLNLRGVALALVGADSAHFAEVNNIYPGFRGRVSYIAKLYDQEAHVIGGPEIRSLADLAGKVVNADVQGSGTLITATAIFEALRLPVKLATDTPTVGLEKLKRGEIAALVYVIGKPGRLFTAIPPNSGLHLVPVQAPEALSQTYEPATFTHADYPALIEEGSTVETIAVPVLLTAYNWLPGSPRYRSLSAFTSLFFQRSPDLLQPPYHAKWRDVDLSAAVPGWTRAPYAQQWLDRSAAALMASKGEREEFTKWANGIGLTTMTPAQHEQLLSLWRLGQRQPRQ